MQNMQGQSINDIEILYFKLHTWDYEFDYDIELHSSDDAYMMHKCIATAILCFILQYRKWIHCALWEAHKCLGRL